MARKLCSAVNAVGHAAWRLVWLSLALGRSLFVLLCVVRWCLLSGFGACWSRQELWAPCIDTPAHDSFF